MNKRLATVLTVCVFSSVFLSCPTHAAEDTAQLTFSKTAVSRRDLQIYTVRKGDTLSAIVRKLPDVRERDIPELYRVIGELNPDVEDLNKLRAGLPLVVPGKVLVDEPAKPSPPVPSISASGPAPIATPEAKRSYTVRKGDSLIRIVHRELNIKSRTQDTLKTIKALNPAIADVNKIFEGQIIVLPGASDTAAAVTVPPAAAAEKPLPPLPEAADPARAKQPIYMSDEARLAAIKQIITGLGGSVITSGNYYLPISRTEQWTIDCAAIPVIELPTGTTLFLDFDRRAHRQLRRMLAERWKNHHLLSPDKKDDLISLLKKIFQTDRNFDFVKTDQLLSAGTTPGADMVVDWLITRKSQSGAAPVAGALRLVYNEAPLFPGALIAYARRNGTAVTEIAPEKGLVSNPEELYSLQSTPVLASHNAITFAQELLSLLEIGVEPDEDVQVFDIARDGFNLSIKADLVARHEGRKRIILSRNLPPQFVSILEKAGNELIVIPDEEPRLETLEKILRGFGIPSATGYFTFSGTDIRRAPYTIGFAGTKIKASKTFYAVNSDFDEQISGLLAEGWNVHIIRY